MKIEIDDDCIDSIMQSAILNDYISLTQDIEAADKNPKAFHEDDVAAFKDVVAALEVLGGWYFCQGEFEKAVKQAMKQK
jgi:hypothetical protein